MIRFLHAADLHLDSPFASLAPELAARRRAEQRALLTDLTEAADAAGCGVMLLSGDLFDSENAYPETVEAMIRAFSACRAQIFISPGNHDCLLPGSPYCTSVWPANVHIFRTAEPEAVELPEQKLCVWGAGFAERRASGLLEGFRAPRDGNLHIMVLHGDACDPDSPYNAVTAAQIAASGLQYLALGHVHAASGLLHAGGTAYAWPGCTAGRGFDECGEKGAYLGTVTDGGAVELQFLPLGTRRYVSLRVDAAGDPAAAVEAALPSRTQDDIYRIILTGTCERPDLRQLHARFAQRFFSLTLRDETQPPRGLWDGAEDDTLRGIFLGLLRAQYDRAADGPERQRIAQAARLGVLALDGREEETL